MKKSLLPILIAAFAMLFWASCKKSGCTDEDAYSSVQIYTLSDFKTITSFSSEDFHPGTRYYVDSGYACFELADTIFGVCSDPFPRAFFNYRGAIDHTTNLTVQAKSMGGRASKIYMQKAKINTYDMSTISMPFDTKGGNDIEVYLTYRCVTQGSFELDSILFSSQVYFLEVGAFYLRAK